MKRLSTCIALTLPLFACGGGSDTASNGPKTAGSALLAANYSTDSGAKVSAKSDPVTVYYVPPSDSPCGYGYNITTPYRCTASEPQSPFEFAQGYCLAMNLTNLKNVTEVDLTLQPKFKNGGSMGNYIKIQFYSDNTCQLPINAPFQFTPPEQDVNMTLPVTDGFLFIQVWEDTGHLLDLTPTAFNHL